MKKTLIFQMLFLVSTFNMFSQNIERVDTLFWHEYYSTAKLAAKKSNKPILIYFTGSDWCAPCKTLSQDFFENQEFIKVASKFELLKIDYPKNFDLLKEGQLEKNKKMMERFNPKKTFPLLVVLKPNGKEIDRISGYSSLRVTNYHFNFIYMVLKK